ncbi:MAG: L,D-transpeptidase family protein [Magnetococcales bacterium]|nr:L,D-transpeptidase family protein [Magnetococcales bacterium]
MPILFFLLLMFALICSHPAAAESRRLELAEVVGSHANLPTGQPSVWAPLAKGEDLFGPGVLMYTVRGDETLLQVGRYFDVGYNGITLANPKVDRWMPPPGTQVRIPLLHIYPGDHDGHPELIINRAEMRLYYQRRDGWIETYPIGVGREGYDTPLTDAKVVRKMANPTWYVPESIRKEDPSKPATVPPGPDNPLGTHAIYMTLPGYLIHGTNRPFGVGRRVSHGCIRLYPEDIVRLYRKVEPGLRVRIIDRPAKAGWRGDQLYLEAHPTLKKKERGLLPGKASEAIEEALRRRGGAQAAHVDWTLVEKMTRSPDGIPRVIGQLTREGGAVLAENAPPEVAAPAPSRAATKVGKKQAAPPAAHR